jgi:general L-amino acid transport system permease protein
VTRVPEDLEHDVLLAAEEPVVEVAPAREPVGPGEWVRQNLFSSWRSGLLTVLAAAFAAWAGYRFLRWVFVTADWEVLKANLRVYMVGRFPLEEIWRVWVSLDVLILLAGLSRGALVRAVRDRRFLAVRAGLWVLLALALLYLLEGVTIWILIGTAAAIYGLGVVVGRAVGSRLRVPLLAAWVLAFPAIVVIIRGFDGVAPERWGGFMLNVMVAVVAIFASFPLGLLLALGRRSALPAVRLVCVGFIEFVRGVPLVSLLIFGELVLPLLLPPGLSLSSIVRAMMMFTIFSSAYVAEIVRGGLQGIPDGQYEAARAVGLSTTRMMGLVILPQALRATIPAMISHFISLFKDTSLLAAIAGFSELLDVSRRAASSLEFLGEQAEALIPAAFIFWLIASSMGRWSQRVERRVGVGVR